MDGSHLRGRAVDAVGERLLEPLVGVPLQFFTGRFLYWAVVFFVLAIVAALLGARGVAGITMTIAKWFVIIFLVLAVVSLVL